MAADGRRRRAIYIGSTGRSGSGATRTRTSKRSVAPAVAGHHGSGPPDGARVAGRRARRPPDGGRGGGRSRPLGPLVGFLKRHDRLALLVVGFLLAFGAAAIYDLVRAEPAVMTREEIGESMMELLGEYDSLPAVSNRAYEAIAPSVVRVRRLSGEDDLVQEDGVGTGVVIVEDGQILTNLHVVQGAERLGVIFADGFETEATVVSVQPENDLALLQAAVVPEGVPPATMASAAGLRPGDQVVAVGHPFGIGPSTSAGVVSGLGRSYYAQGRSFIVDNLIQFDAAANPGNSGGPLVNRRGEVVGIVTSILNPTEDGVFIGIGFAVPIENAARALGPNPF